MGKQVLTGEMNLSKRIKNRESKIYETKKRVSQVRDKF